jgi:hypothetical protein
MSAITVQRPTEDAAIAAADRSVPVLLPVGVLRTRLSYTHATRDRAGTYPFESRTGSPTRHPTAHAALWMLVAHRLISIVA